MYWVQNCDVAAHGILLDRWPKTWRWLCMWQQISDIRDGSRRSHWQYDGCSSPFLSFVSFSFQTCHRHFTSQTSSAACLTGFLSLLVLRFLWSAACLHILLFSAWFLAIPRTELAVLWSLTRYSPSPIFGFVSPAACWFHPALLQPWQCSAGTPPRLHLLHPLISSCSHDITTISDLLCLFVPLLKIIDSYWLRKKKRRN